MRLLHTSDWHIGRRFKGVDLGEYQRRALDWVADTVEREHVDVLCVSGDVYDQPRPSAAAVQLFAPVFERLASMRVDGRPLEVVFTPGNHDSAERLGFGAGAMVPNMHMRCRIEDVATPVVVERGGEALAIYAVPYLDPDAARPVLTGMLRRLREDRGGVVSDRVGSEDVKATVAETGSDQPDAYGIPSLLLQNDGDLLIPRSHEGVMTAAMTLITRDLAERRRRNPRLGAVLMAHAFVSGAMPSDSERTITVGGVDSVPARLFTDCGLDYLALGHLHRPQRVTIPLPDADHEPTFHLGRTPQARYSGSLLSYSFSEAPAVPRLGNGKQVAIVDFAADGASNAGGTGVRDVATPDVQSGQPALVTVRGDLEYVLGDVADEHRDDWVSVTVEYDEYPRGLYEKIDGRYPHALEKQAVCVAQRDGAGRSMVDLREVHDEMDVLDGFVRYTLGRAPHDDEAAVLRAAVERARASSEEYAGADGGHVDGNSGEEAAR